MKEKILDILEKHYHGRNFIESRCADDILDLFNVVGQSEHLHSCKYVKRVGESCTLNNNCKYPNCE